MLQQQRPTPAVVTLFSAQQQQQQQQQQQLQHQQQQQAPQQPQQPVVVAPAPASSVTVLPASARLQPASQGSVSAPNSSGVSVYPIYGPRSGQQQQQQQQQQPTEPPMSVGAVAAPPLGGAGVRLSVTTSPPVSVVAAPMARQPPAPMATPYHYAYLQQQVRFHGMAESKPSQLSKKRFERFLTCAFSLNLATAAAATTAALAQHRARGSAPGHALSAAAAAATTTAATAAAAAAAAAATTGARGGHSFALDARVTDASAGPPIVHGVVHGASAPTAASGKGQ